MNPDFICHPFVATLIEFCLAGAVTANITKYLVEQICLIEIDNIPNELIDDVTNL